MATIVNRPAPVNALAQYEAELARLNNQPRPYLPDWFVRELARIGGSDTITGKPNFRIVWGQSREAAKMFVEDGVAIWRPKYLKSFLNQLIRLDMRGSLVSPVIEKNEPVAMPCYFIEKYVAARNIPREKWEEWRWFYNQETGSCDDVLGPFPEDGCYVEFLCLKAETGEMIPPQQAVLDELAERIAWERRANELSPSEAVRIALQSRREEEKRRDLEHIQKVADIMRFYKAGVAGDKTVSVLTDNLTPMKRIN